MTLAGYSEDELVEQPAIALLAELGWETVNAYHEFDHGASALGRDTKAEMILVDRHTRDLLLPKLISGEVDVSELEITIPQEAEV